MKKRIAIIGAGISGLTIAQRLTEYAEVVVFEKARGVGGRMSTRYAEPFYFDHGTQFFTARGKAFQRFIAPMISDGLIAPWEGKVITLEADKKVTDRLWFEPHYVAVPHMNSLCKYMARELEIRMNTEVAPLGEKHQDGWHLMDKDGAALGVFDWVISTAPPVQTQRLFGGAVQALEDVKLLACYTLMFGFNRPWKKSWIGAKVHASPIEWIAVNSSKPQRNDAITSLVVHSSNAWAEAHADDNMKEAEQFLRAEFESVSGIDTADADYVSCHRWRYAIVDDAPRELQPFMDDALGIASAGDWCSASRIEDAWCNATALADDVVKLLKT